MPKESNKLGRRKALKKLGLSAGLLSAAPTISFASNESKNKGIKIKKINPLIVKGSTRLPKFLFVEVITDQGITGYGECYPWQLHRGNTKVLADIKMLSLELVGEDPAAINYLTQTYGSGDKSLEYRAAFSVIEIALWDILGKACNKPISDLLGGAVRSEIPLYANHGIFAWLDKSIDTNDPELRRDRAILAKEKGFTFFKWDPFTTGGSGGKEPLKRDMNEVRMIRNAVGDDMKIGIDAHTRFNLEGAIKAAKMLEEFNIEFFEEPMKKEDTKYMPQLKEQTTVPLALGERLFDMNEAKYALDFNVLSYIQPEIGNFGGIGAGWKAAQFAAFYGVKFLPHLWTSRILTLALAQVCACAPNLSYMEFPATAPEDEWEKDLLLDPIEIKNGKLALPNKPGLGSDINMELIRSRLIS